MLEFIPAAVNDPPEGFELTDFCGSPDGAAWVRQLIAEFNRYFNSKRK
jgi:hypothetical protein